MTGIAVVVAAAVRALTDELGVDPGEGIELAILVLVAVESAPRWSASPWWRRRGRRGGGRPHRRAGRPRPRRRRTGPHPRRGLAVVAVDLLGRVLVAVERVAVAVELSSPSPSWLSNWSP